MISRCNAQTSIQYGISLIEVMVVCAIIGALVMAAAPSLNSMLQRKEIDNVTRTLAATFELAERTAARLSDIVLICPITPDHTCDTNNWSQGWGLYQLNRNQQRETLKLIKRFDGSDSVQIKTKIAKIPVKKDGFYHLSEVHDIEICNQNQDEYWSKLIISKRGYKVENHHFDEEIAPCSS